MVTRVCIVRHGETDWNVARRLQGHLDVPLNALGRQQAQRTARALNGQRFDACYASDLLRTRETAALIAQALRLEVTQTAALRERHYGLFQGLTYEEAAQTHPALYARFEARDPDFAFPGHGESLRSVAGRIGALLHELAERHAGQRLLLVTHGGVLDIVHRLASGKPLEARRDFAIPNAALNWLRHAPAQGWQIDAWAVQPGADALDELPNA